MPQRISFNYCQNAPILRRSWPALQRERLLVRGQELLRLVLAGEDTRARDGWHVAGLAAADAVQADAPCLAVAGSNAGARCVAKVLVLEADGLPTRGAAAEAVAVLDAAALEIGAGLEASRADIGAVAATMNALLACGALHTTRTAVLAIRIGVDAVAATARLRFLALSLLAFLLALACLALAGLC